MLTNKSMKKMAICLMAAIIMMAAIMSPAYATPSAKSHGNPNVAGSITSPVTTVADATPEPVTTPANGTPSLEVRYAVVEAKVNLMIGVMNAIADLASVPDSARQDLLYLITELNTDLETLNTYVVANDSAGFNACIKETLQPDMINASQTIKADTKMFKEWGITKEQLKELKDTSKQLRDEYSVGAAVSAVASAKHENVQAYMNKAGIKAQVKEAKAEAKANKKQGNSDTSSPSTEEGST